MISTLRHVSCFGRFCSTLFPQVICSLHTNVPANFAPMAPAGATGTSSGAQEEVNFYRQVDYFYDRAAVLIEDKLAQVCEISFSVFVLLRVGTNMVFVFLAKSNNFRKFLILQELPSREPYETKRRLVRNILRVIKPCNNVLTISFPLKYEIFPLLFLI